MPYKCEICGKMVADGEVCCGAGMRNRNQENEAFQPDPGR